MLQDLIPRKPYIQDNNGNTFIYDKLRHKWLSVYRIPLSFSINYDNVKGERWLNYSTIPSNLTGYHASKDLILVSATAFSNTIGSGTFQVISDNDIKANLNLSLEKSKYLVLDVPIISGEKIGVKLLMGKFAFPAVQLELAAIYK